MHHCDATQTLDAPRLRIHRWATWALICGLASQFGALPQGRAAFQVLVCWLLGTVLVPHVSEQLGHTKRITCSRAGARQLPLLETEQADAWIVRWRGAMMRQWNQARQRNDAGECAWQSGLSALLAVAITLALATYMGPLPTLLVAGTLALCALLSITSKQVTRGIHWALQQGLIASLAWALVAVLVAPPTLATFAQAGLAGLFICGHHYLSHNRDMTDILPWCVAGAGAVAITLVERQVWPAAMCATLALARLAIPAESLSAGRQRSPILSGLPATLLLVVIAVTSRYWSW